MRTIPEIDARYPLWQQADFVRDYDEGRFYLPDAEEGRREMLVTSTLDALPQQCLRLPGPTFITLVAALCVGGIFIFATYKLYWWAAISTVLSFAVIMVWLWTGTGEIPEKAEKDVGLGTRVPLYLSGRDSVGWWAMLITMLALFTAFVSLVFGYVFYWTLDARFLDTAASGPGVAASLGAVAAVAASWALTMLARRWNAADRTAAFYGALGAALALALGGAAALVATVTSSSLDPTATAYAATVWLLVAWAAIHVGLGAVMQAYCLARRLAGRMTATHDLDLGNVILFWHFTIVTVAAAMLVVAGGPHLG